MSRISIIEQDLTVPVPVYDTTDVVFVPGFSSLNLSEDGAAAQGVPTLCRSIAEFTKYFGSHAPVFSSNQNYPAGFSVNATNGLSNPWFKVGDADPSYIYACELLAQGIPVVYERMNMDTADISVDAAYSYLKDMVFCSTRSATPLYPTAVQYSDATAYSVGDVVYTGTTTRTYYKCTAAVTAGQHAPPDDDYWALLPSTQDTDQPLLNLALPVKYITSGGYPTHEFTGIDIATNIAKVRGDCVALVDYLDNPTRKLAGTAGDDSIYSSVAAAASEYAAMFVPWIVVRFTQSYTVVGGTTATSNQHMPPSFAYLTALASALAYASNTQAIAGVTRGQIPNLVALNTNYTLTNTIAESTFQPDTGVSINGITDITTYGYRIWGNRTMKDNNNGTTATSFLNIRNVVSDIKKVIYSAAVMTLFEPNAQTTWLSFTSKITPFLDSLISNYGISRYQIERNTVQQNGAPLPKTEMSAVITIYPVYSIEKISINVSVRDDDTVEVSE